VSALILMASSSNAVAAISSGADGLFRPASDVTLTVPTDGVFNFAEVRIDAGITVSFAEPATSMSWLALGDIFIGGTINAAGWTLGLETPSLIVFNQTSVIHSGNMSALASNLQNTLHFSERRAGVPYVPFVKVPYYVFVGRKPLVPTHLPLCK
jgi:hypothetical protein